MNTWMKLALAALGAFGAIVPTASADTTSPVWTCRASAAYAELVPLLGTQRVEPVLANGFADTATPDREQCAGADAGVTTTTLPPGPPAALQVSVQAAFARTAIQPVLGAARDQSVTATGGVTDDVNITAGGLNVSVRAATSQAQAGCQGTVPTLTGSSTVAQVTVNGTPINIPAGNPQDTVIIDPLQPLLRIVLNEREVTGTATDPDQALTVRAVHVQLLQSVGGPPVANVVVGEAKVDRHGAVCAAAPPPPTCPAGSAPRPGSSPLTCVLTVTAPCPSGSTADPASGGACVIVRPTPPGPCPSGTVREPNSGVCILVLQRPCPSGSKADPNTNVCVLRVPSGSGSSTDGNGSNGSNGGIGSANGPRVTCGRLTMRFVPNGKQRYTSRFGQRVVTRGRLVTCGAKPRSIVGARIDVVHTIRGGRRLIKTGLRSRPGGRLTLILPLNLRTRTITYAYRPDLSKQRVSSRRKLGLTVRNRAGRVVR